MNTRRRTFAAARVNSPLVSVLVALSLAPRTLEASPPRPAPTAAAPTLAPDSHALTAIPYQSYRLKNGLQVILSVDRRLPRVAVNVWYHVGPVNEPKGRSGFAHLFEHLMFESSKHVGAGFDRLMESMGASNVNGTTNWDRTNYYETVPSEYLETALWIESDRMGFMTLARDRLEAQRAVVKNERRQSFDNAPYGSSDLALLDALFPQGHPYHGAVIGSMQDLSQASLQDVHDFYATYYAPNNATLTLVGNFDPDVTRRWIAKYFGPLAARELPNTELHVTPPLRAALRKVLRDKVQLARVATGFIAPPAYSKADAALRLATTILADGKATRLYQRLIVQKQVASDVSAWVDPNRLATIVTLEAKATSLADVNVLERELNRAVQELGQDGPTARELRRAKQKLLLHLVQDTERLNGDDGESGRAGLLQRLNCYTMNPGYLAQWLQTLERTSARDVATAVRTWLKASAAATVITLPEPGQGHSESQAP